MGVLSAVVVCHVIGCIKETRGCYVGGVSEVCRRCVGGVGVSRKNTLALLGVGSKCRRVRGRDADWATACICKEDVMWAL